MKVSDLSKVMQSVRTIDSMQTSIYFFAKSFYIFLHIPCLPRTTCWSVDSIFTNSLLSALFWESFYPLITSAESWFYLYSLYLTDLTHKVKIYLLVLDSSHLFLNLSHSFIS